MVSGAVAKLVEDFHGKAIGILLRLDQEWRDGADEYCFFNSSLAVFRDVASYLAATGGMADVNRVLEVQSFHDFGDIGGVRVHVVAGRRLGGAAMPAAIMRNYPVAVLKKKHHLRVPVVRGKRPAVMKEQRLTRAPIFVINLGSILRC